MRIFKARLEYAVSESSLLLSRRRHLGAEAVSSYSDISTKSREWLDVSCSTKSWRRQKWLWSET